MSILHSSVVHLTDLVNDRFSERPISSLREALLDARRDTVTHRAITISDTFDHNGLVRSELLRTSSYLLSSCLEKKAARAYTSKTLKRVTSDTREIFVLNKTVDESKSARVLIAIGCKHICYCATPLHITMCLRVLRDALVSRSRATASERAMVRATTPRIQ